MQGKAALLNKHHLYNWTVINEVAHATEKPRTATLPDKLPFDVWSPPNNIHLFIFVHRVERLEAGLTGQVLYLEAEAAGVRGTGIGCYFDDSVHDVLGLTDETFQSLYHFTVGMPLDDNRLQTLPAYAHLG